ncbi:FprA family A-type flavoprotein [candidate division KSB1 bacterium]|nr:FprA family A-type flavoprotein [candidate division KSB1 bacterium]
MKPFEIKPGVFWAGALHPDLRIFDILMKTKNGTTYNSYLIKGEKTAVIDTVKGKFTKLYLENLSQVCDIDKIDYVIIQHNEPDHSGSLAALLDAAPSAQVVCSKPAVKYVQNVLNRDIEPLAAQNDTTLELGAGKTLRFYATPFLHWPDTMMTFLENERVLFPCDVFGSHFCDVHMFDDAITRDFWPEFRYYFDVIMRPFKKNVQNALKKINGLNIDILAPSHGPVIRNNISKYLEAYDLWSAAKPSNDPKRVLIYYASAHFNTELLAEWIAENLQDKGLNVELFDVVELDFNGHLDLIESADAVLFGSPTINGDAVKPVWDVLSSLATLDLKGKIGASFGSYAWSGEATKMLDARMADLKFKVPVEGFVAVLVPGKEEKKACFEFCEKLAAAISAK